MFRFFIIITFFTLLVSCNNKRKIRYSALNDLVVGVQQLILFENGDFYLELSLGGEKGKYIIKNDTVFLYYFNKSENWPDKLYMTEKYFETISNETHYPSVKINRTKQ